MGDMIWKHHVAIDYDRKHSNLPAQWTVNREKTLILCFEILYSTRLSPNNSAFKFMF